MLSLMSIEEMTKELEELMPTEAAMLRLNYETDGIPTLERGVLAILLILAKRVEDLEKLVTPVK